jgi:hypothetical protein
MESFWGSMQIELLNRKKWMTYVELATAMADYIVTWSRYAGDPRVGQQGRQGWGHYVDRRPLWDSNRWSSRVAEPMIAR